MRGAALSDYGDPDRSGLVTYLALIFALHSVSAQPGGSFATFATLALQVSQV